MKYYLLIAVNLALIGLAALRAWFWYSTPRHSPAEIHAEKATAAAPTAAAKPSSTVSDFVRPGTLFSGTATEPGRADFHFVLIEITDAPAGAQKVSVVLRNDGGWSDVRAFQGDWIVGPDGAGKLTLQTQISDRIPGAGLMLDEPGDILARPPISGG